MKLIVGLGNPGKAYENSRHNTGFMVIDSFAKEKKTVINNNKWGALYKELTINDEKIIFLKPQQYINISGDVIIKFVNFYKINIADILIITDDLDLELGKYKLKYKGSSAGHNGLKNIETNFKTKEYKRLKIGISNNKEIDTKDYVIGNFTKEEQSIIKDIFTITNKLLEDYLLLDFENLMNKYNGK